MVLSEVLSIVLKIEKKLEKDLEEEYLLLVLPCPRGGNPPFYTGEFRERKFSETRIHVAEYLCVRTGAKVRFRLRPSPRRQAS